MANYRPKSLGELNDIYGKTIAAEKAIKKGTSHIHADENEKTANHSPLRTDTQKPVEQTVSKANDITGEVNNFIKKFSTDDNRPRKMTPPAYKPESPAKPTKPKNTTPVIKQQQPATKPRDYKKPETVIYKGQKQAIGAIADSDKIEERSELMDEYLKIMNDDEDERSKRRQKWKLGHKSGKKSNKVTSEEELIDENDAIAFDEELSGPSKLAQNDEPLPEVQEQEKIIAEESENITAEPMPSDDGIAESEEKTEVIVSEDDIEEFSNVFNDDMTEVSEEKLKGHKSHGFAKVILSLLLVIDLILVIATGLCNTVLGVNKGTEFYNGLSLFTSTADYPDAGIKKGDLVLAESKQPENQEQFVYINYAEKMFMFGKRTGAIVNDDGQVVYIAENQGERVLINRDDAKGVVQKTIPIVGYFATVFVSYFIPAMVILIALAILITLILCVGLRDKTKAQEKEAAKQQKKLEKEQEKVDSEEFADKEDSETDSEDNSEENTESENSENETESDETKEEKDENLFDGID